MLQELRTSRGDSRDLAGILAALDSHSIDAEVKGPMLRLKPAQRAILADKVADAANLVAGAIVIGFFIGEPRASVRLLVAGIALWTTALVIAIIVLEKDA